MISISYLFEELSDEELDNHINDFMGNLGKSLKKHKEENQSEGEKLKDKTDNENSLIKKFPWLNKNKESRI